MIISPKNLVMIAKSSSDTCKTNALLNAAQEIERLNKEIGERIPIYLARRRGIEKFFTCDKSQYDELIELDNFECKVAYE
jgi:hypothetical protein